MRLPKVRSVSPGAALVSLPALLLAALLLIVNAAAAAPAEPADSVPADSLQSWARIAAANRGWNQVKELVEQWLERKPPSAEMLGYLGQAELYLGEAKEAEELFGKVLDLDKSNLSALEGLCEVYLIRDREKEMLKTLERLRQFSADSVTCRYYEALAVDRFELKGYDQTFFWDTLEELVRAHPEREKIFNALCDAYINDRFLERGILFLTELIDQAQGEHPEARFQLARIYTHTGDKELAREMFGKIYEAGLDKIPPRQRYLMARELFRLEEGQLGCEAYFSAARQMDDQLAEEAFDELRDITRSDEKREFKLTPSGKKGIFLISFWGRKDPTLTTIKNERLIEHYRRIEHVKEKYHSPLRPGYDERGRVYIKHGEPDQTISYSGNWAVRENVSWLYSKGKSNPLIYHFVERNNVYRMVYRLEEALVSDLESEMSSGGRNAVELFRSRGEIHPKYDQLANELEQYRGYSINEARRTTLLDIFSAEEELTERGFTEGEVTETFEHEFEEEPMNFYYYPATLRGGDSTSVLGVFFALPTDQVKVSDPFGAVEIPVELEVVLYDSWWQETARTTQHKTYRVPNFTPDKRNMIPDLLSLQVPPGNYHLAVRLKQQDRNLMQIYKSNFYVDSYRSPDSLYLSDLILAANIEEDPRPGKFTIRGHRLQPMPSASFKKAQPMFVYYELYNLKPDTTGGKRLKVEYVISFAGGDLNIARKIINTLGRFIGVRNEVGKVVTTFEREIAQEGSVDPVYISIDPTEYLPGNYNLMVTVEDLATGQRAAKDVTFLITD